MTSDIQAAKALGWASLAIGATELAATDWLQDQMGVNDQEIVLRTFGAREIATGITILAQPGLNKTLAAGLWGRVAGDAVDVTLLLAARAVTRNPKGLLAVTAIVAGATLMDVVVAARVQRALARAVTVSKAAKARVSPTSAVPNSSATTLRAARAVTTSGAHG